MQHVRQKKTKTTLETIGILLPRDAKTWLKRCEAYLRAAPKTYQSLENAIAPGYGITWFTVSSVWPAVNRQRERVQWWSPHSDDLQFAGAVTMRHHVQQGDEASELLWTLGSNGRAHRGFWKKGAWPFWPVRLAEALAGAARVGIHRVGVITLPDGTYGFPEWLWDGNDVTLRTIGMSILRQCNPHIVYSPHPDVRIDTHPDHASVAAEANWAIAWGTESEFYSDDIPGTADAWRIWRRYATWPGSHTLPVGVRVQFAPDDKLAAMKREALSYFLSQNGSGYAAIGEGYTAYHGGMATVGTDTLMCAEVFDEVRPPAVLTVFYQSSPSDTARV